MEETITVNFGGEEKEIPIEEAKALIVKALEYAGKEDDGARLRAALERLSEREGIPFEECIETLNEDCDHARARFTHLLNEYPEMNAEELDSDFFTNLNSGITPTEAYQKLLIAKLKEKLRDKENHMSTLGSAKSDVAAESVDKFLEGFYGAKY